MPLKALLAPVSIFKDNIAAAFEGLMPEVRGMSGAEGRGQRDGWSSREGPEGWVGQKGHK